MPLNPDFYGRVGVKLASRESHFDLNKNLWVPQTCAYATLRQSVANLRFCNVSFNFATAISKFDTSSSYHIIRTQIAKVTAAFSLFCTIGISMYQKSTSPYTLFLTYLPQAYSPLERSWRTDWQRKFFAPCSLSTFFSPSARGPTCRHNSTGLAKLWGGWPIELGTTNMLE